MKDWFRILFLFLLVSYAPIWLTKVIVANAFFARTFVVSESQFILEIILMWLLYFTSLTIIAWIFIKTKQKG